MLMLHRTTSLSLRALASRFTGGGRNYSRDYDSSDDEKETKLIKNKHKEAATKSETKPESDTTEEPAITRLNRLLASMPTENAYTLGQKSSVSLPLPGEANRKRKEAAKQEKANKDIFVAAKRVASLASDVEQKQQIESELLAKLLGHDKDESLIGETSSNKGDGESKKPANEMSLSELIVGMKIDRTLKPQEQTRGDFVRRSIAAKAAYQQQQQQYPHQQQRQPRNAFAQPRERKREPATYTGSVNLFGSEPFGIFKNSTELRDSPDMLSTWAHLQQNELKLLVTHPPANYFEKIALWTEQGKVWRFPIDNEQDWRDEVDVDFSEHIFLEQHLEGWCPERGPIRHYMELVCVGLSKNPYLKASEKKDHILWYRDYFESKKDILKNLMSQMAQQKGGEQKGHAVVESGEQKQSQA